MIQVLKIETEDGQILYWNLDFSDQGTIRLTSPAVFEKLPWIKLGFNKCPSCTLNEKASPVCPVAEVLAQYARDLADRLSYERVKVFITEENNRHIILEQVPLQTVVGELVRWAVFQSGCPIGRKVKPAMTRLPPFPTNDKILQALAIFFALQNRDADGRVEAEQNEFMNSLHEVFGCLAKRLQHVGTGDAYLNGVVIVDSLSLLFSLSAPELVKNAVSECRFW